MKNMKKLTALNLNGWLLLVVLMIVKLTPALMLQRLQLLLAQFRPLFLQFLDKKSFATINAASNIVQRDILGFTPILNNFAAQYVISDDKDSVVRGLAKKSVKYGFTTLGQAATNYLEGKSESSSIDLFSVLLISSMQMKDDTLLRYFLEDIDKYLEVNCKNVYEILRRISHYRRYSIMIDFLNTFISVPFDVCFDR